MLINTAQKQTSPIKRGLALLLLAFIFYGTTVEAAHRHGRVLPSPASAATFVGPNSSNGRLNTTPGCNDCLICQLHQNFSATLISVKPHA
ncbi:MAG TPA: hypothetical protein VJW17_04635, partial [Pyrinomonadaceae bacterium]|nr:hypothetical protein [Pyrinomonadaceae bacterium]